MPPDLRSFLAVFGRIGLLSFGGPAAQIALMHRELVDRHAWLGEKEFLNALSFCMLLPGPEAMQLATYAGWKLRGSLGGLVAGLLFVVPGALVVLALAAVYARLGPLPAVQAVFLGIKATVVVVVIEALLRVARRALIGVTGWIIAAVSFAAIFALHLPFPVIILAAGLFGAWASPGTPRPPPPGPPVSDASLPDTSSVEPRAPRTLRTVALWLALWIAPVAALAVSRQVLLLEIARFFSILAVVTFGGAYAVLAYMTQTVVADKGWLDTAQMMDALGLAETTPGPLILVTEFVGYLAGHGQGGPALGVAAALVTLWVTFVPCFLWIFAGAPYLERIAARPRLTGALSAITAAVVGVILNLSIWFALHVLFRRVGDLEIGILNLPWPAPASLDPVALALAGVAGVLLLVRHWPLPVVLAAMAGLGFALWLGGLA